MKRPRWANGPLFTLKPGVIHLWLWMMATALACAVAVAVKGDLWLMAAMWPGIAFGITAGWFFDPRYKKDGGAPDAE
jgi:hypothetical protein